MTDRAEIVRSALTAVDGIPADVQHMRLAAGGNSRECWIVDVRWGRPADRVVLRCDPDDWIRPAEMEKEIHGLRIAEHVGIPAPRVIATHEDVGGTRPFAIVDYVAGESIPRRIHRDPEYARARERFASQCGDILRRLHSAPFDLAAGLGTRDPVPELRRRYANASSPSPVLAGALRWLEAHEPPPGEQVAVHGDFRLGNMLMGLDGILGVLDWETSHLGDPYEDLAWLCQRAWRFGGTPPVGGLGQQRDLFAAYTDAPGDIDMERLHWWLVWGATFWALASRELGDVVREDAGESVETAAIARQVCVQEQYVLEELSWHVS